MSGTPPPRAIVSRCRSGAWRNWQTRWLQVPVAERSWGFKSPLAHASLGPDPRNGGSSEFCTSLEPRQPIEHPQRPATGAGLAVLDRLAALTSPPALPPPKWWHWVLGLDSAGRLSLPADARQLCDGVTSVRASSHGSAVVLRRDGAGAPTPVDRRGRVQLPTWLAARWPHAGAVFVAARRPDASTVVVRAATGLDALADALAGEVA